MQRPSSLDSLTANNTHNNNLSERSTLMTKKTQHPKRTGVITGSVIFILLFAIELIIFLVERPFFNKALPPLNEPWNLVTGAAALTLGDAVVGAAGGVLTYLGLRPRSSTGYEPVPAASGSTATTENTDPEASTFHSDDEADQDEQNKEAAHDPLASLGSHVSSRRSSTTNQVFRVIASPGSHVTLNITLPSTSRPTTPTAHAEPESFTSSAQPKRSAPRERRLSITSTPQTLPAPPTMRLDDLSGDAIPVRSTFSVS